MISSNIRLFDNCVAAASSLIRGMLTPKATERANIVDICSHWWINEGYEASCLDEAEHLANLTPVRLDLLLSLAKAENKMPLNQEANNNEVYCTLIIPFNKKFELIIIHYHISGCKGWKGYSFCGY